MVTPFDDDGALDLPAAVDLARWLAAHGSDGLVLSGSTGESSVLTDDEKVALWRAVAEAVTIPVIAGTGSNDTAHSVAMTARGHRVRRRRRARGHAVLQPALAGRPLRALPGGGRGGGGPPRRALRHPGPRRPAHRHADHAPPGPGGAGHRGAQGRGGRPADHGAPRRAGAGGLRDLQRRRRHDAAPHGGRRGRRDQRRRALGRAAVPPGRRRLRGRRPRRRHRRERRAARLLRLRVHAGVPEPAAGQGHAAARWACGWASAACRWARPPPSSTPRRQKILAAVGPPAVTVAPLG